MKKPRIAGLFVGRLVVYLRGMRGDPVGALVGAVCAAGGVVRLRV